PRGGGARPPVISALIARAASITAAAPLALSLAMGAGWHRWPTISTCSSVSPAIWAVTASIAPSAKGLRPSGRGRTGGSPRRARRSIERRSSAPARGLRAKPNALVSAPHHHHEAY